MQNTSLFDTFKHIAILGGGPAGYPCAIRLAQHGFKVTLIEQESLGGTCLNWGCIPSKALIHWASDYYALKSGHFASLGIQTEALSLDWPTMQNKMNTHIQTLRNGIQNRLKQLGVRIIRGTARFLSPSTLELETPSGFQQLQADAYIIASGAETFVPDTFKSLSPEYALTVRSIFQQEALPDSLGIIGAGVIGLELAQTMARFGVNVHVFERMPNTLTAFDASLTKPLLKGLEEEGVSLHFNANVNGVHEGSEHVEITTENGDAFECQRLLIAPGRRPNTEDLRLEKAGVHTHENSSGILTNTLLQTNQPHIFAIGDCRHRSQQLAHVATHQGLVLADTLAQRKQGLDAQAQIPSVVYTQPELARVGLNLESASAKGFTPKKTTLPFAAIGRAHVEGITHGQVILIADAPSGLVLGAEVLGPHADDLIAEITVAIEMAATVEDLALTIHPHPSISEAWMEAAERHLGHGIHIT